MIPKTIVEMLTTTLDDIRRVSNGSDEWLSIISMFENAIESARNNQFFSLMNAPKLYLTFDRNYKSAMFVKICNAAYTSEKFFIELIKRYIVNNYGFEGVNRNIEELARFDDIFGDFSNFLLSGERFTDPPAVVVEGYSAKRLCTEMSLTPLGAFNYLLFLKEAPNEALADLEAGSLRQYIILDF